MDRVQRRLQIDLPPRQSAFLWGPRKVGKSTYLEEAFPDSLRYSFLSTDLLLEYTARPALLRERILGQPEARLGPPIVLDEVQKVPALLDEVHWMIESKGLHFILCGSSARKLRRGKANLLGGRAWRFEMFPLTSAELGARFDLLTALNRGTIPDHYGSPNHRRSLRAYVRDYLKEEVFDEGLTRNAPAFTRFFDALKFSHGELTNYSNIARDCGVDSKTVRTYFEILVDTLLGRFVEPYSRRSSRQTILKSPKFYLFDVGVSGIVTGRPEITEPGSDAYGRALEHLVLTEILAHSSYEELDYDIRFWRTRSGQEVDFILGDAEVAVEVKGARRVDNRELRSMKSFMADCAPKSAIVVCGEPEIRVVDGIRILPIQRFLESLWGGEIIR